MGIYYSAISRRTTIIQGVEIAYTNFWGKAPSMFSGPNRFWESFCTRAANTRDLMLEEYPYITLVTDARPGQLARYSEHAVARWHGQCLLDDAFWDTNTVARILRTGHGRYILDQIDTLVA